MNLGNLASLTLSKNDNDGYKPHHINTYLPVHNLFSTLNSFIMEFLSQFCCKAQFNLLNK